MCNLFLKILNNKLILILILKAYLNHYQNLPL